MGSVRREGRHLRLWLNSLLRLVSGTYFALTSLYCLLAFLPYTYCSFIKAPPYAWMPGFTHHQAALYWLAVAAATLANWPVRQHMSGHRSGRRRNTSVPVPRWASRATREPSSILRAESVRSRTCG